MPPSNFGRSKSDRQGGAEPEFDIAGTASLFKVFALLWACFHLLELLVWPVWLLAVWGWFVFFAAAAVLFRPDSVKRFAWLVVASLIKTFYEMPFLPNHVLFFGFQNLVILGTLVVLIIRRRGLVSGASWAAGFAPLLRIQVVALYLISAIQKLNHDFLNPATSCASQSFEQIARDLKVIPHGEWAAMPAIYGALAIEFLIPIFLLIGRTRLLGIAIGLLFHGFLGFHAAAGVYGFSALMYVEFILFLPAPAIDRLARVASWPSLRPLRIGRGRALALLFTVWVFGVLRAQIWLYLNIGQDLDSYWAAYAMGQGFWFVCTAWFVAGYFVVLRETGAGGRLISRAGLVGGSLAALLIVGNAAMPWIGSKTQASFSMFSNLRTEFGENHLFLRRLHWVGAQDDMVEVLSSKPDVFDASLNRGSSQQYSNRGTIMPMFELRRLAHQVDGKLELEFLRGGTRCRALRDADGNVSGEVEVFDAPGFWSRKLLWYRRHVSTSGPMHCTH